MTNKYHRAFQGFVKAFTGAAKAGEKSNPTTIIGVAPSKNIKKFQEQKEKIINTTDAYKKKVNDPEVKKKMNEGTSKTLGNISQILKGKKVKKVEKKAMGGRMGYKGGAGPAGSAKISDKADRAKKAFDMIQTNLNTDFKTMNRTQDSKGRFKDRKSMRKYIDDVSTASTRDSAKVRIDRKLGGGTKGGGMSDTQVKKKYKNLGKLPESIQIKIAGKKIAKKV